MGGPGRTDSEHPPALVSPGQSYMAGLVNASMQEPDWAGSAIFLRWDEQGTGCTPCDSTNAVGRQA